MIRINDKIDRAMIFPSRLISRFHDVNSHHGGSDEKSLSRIGEFIQRHSWAGRSISILCQRDVG